MRKFQFKCNEYRLNTVNSETNLNDISVCINDNQIDESN